MIFNDRTDAGRRLAERLQHLRGENVVVLGLPRGGVPVAFEVASALDAPLDVIVVRKLGVPYQPELALGAIGEGDVRVLDERITGQVRLPTEELAEVERAEQAELLRRVEKFRAGQDRIALTGRTALIVDDGLATGSTARAACQVARAQGAARVILAVPVGAADGVRLLQRDADDVVCLETPARFMAVGQWYSNFRQTTDREVAGLLDRAARRAARQSPERAAVAADDPPLCDEDVEVLTDPVQLAGHLTIPGNPVGVVAFAHGSGSSRHSPRNRYVAAELNQAGLGTLLFDLLTPQEELDRTKVFDVELLAQRLVEVTLWLGARADAGSLPVGYFGASTGAGAALWAAADPKVDVRAVVSRGGRPDLAGPRLADVDAPTLLIVGGRDETVLALNRSAQATVGRACQLIVVPGATHLFEEPGALGRVAALARDWFVQHLTRAAAATL
jgi:putative phosphoribosyl transferase